MSKIITKKTSTLKSLYQTNNNSINNNINDIAVINGLKMKPLTKNNNSMLFNNNIINNNQINSKHFSPLSNRVKSSFPPVIIIIIKIKIIIMIIIKEQLALKKKIEIYSW